MPIAMHIFAINSKLLQSMEKKVIEIPVNIYQFNELSDADQHLVELAMKTTENSYAPFSHFSVGAAAQLANKEIICGSNQENAAFPSGTCAERTTLFYANSRYPNVPVLTIAIAARNEEGQFMSHPISPCGACRQVMAEVQHRNKQPLRVLLYSTSGVYEIACVEHLLPFTFYAESMKSQD